MTDQPEKTECERCIAAGLDSSRCPFCHNAEIRAAQEACSFKTVRGLTCRKAPDFDYHECNDECVPGHRPTLACHPYQSGSSLRSVAVAKEERQ
jgi:pyruvate-formate lyase-activating enzyme